VKPETRLAREAEIEAAAYDLLAQKGYLGMSMLSVAKRAKCSNETMYNWYGDKLGLVRAMVDRNAADAKAVLSDVGGGEKSAIETLKEFGPVLLTLLLSENAIALNRAAAADPSHELGQALATAGRETVVPLLIQVFECAIEEGAFADSKPSEAADLYLRLLIGDLQIRRVIGRLAVPTETEIKSRADEAMEGLAKLLA
jgi:AcrR family transcriptional regulator